VGPAEDLRDRPVGSAGAGAADIGENAFAELHSRPLLARRQLGAVKRLRLFFLYDRRLLGALSRCAWRTVRDLYRAGLRDRRAVPGMVVSIQT